jgi:chromosome segregation ATPase
VAALNDYQLDLIARLNRIEVTTGRLPARLAALEKEVMRMSQELDALTAQVKANTDAEQSAIDLLGQLSTLIKNNVNDPAALTKLAGDLDASKAKLADAIVTNTPAGGGAGGGGGTAGGGTTPAGGTQPGQRQGQAGH